MLVVETIAKIRRAYFAQNKPIKTICRELRVSRKVVRKVIRSRATEFRYERGRQPLPRIDPWRDQLDGLLLENEGQPSRERLTLIRIFKVLSAVLTDGLAAVEAACAEALADGVHSADVVLNILSRHRDPGLAATILTPEALRLRHLPIADCARYDSLRRAS